MESKSKEVQVIDLREIVRKIIKRRRSFYLPLSIVFVLSCIYIFSQPRYYVSDAKLAPEMGGSSSSGFLGSIASSFGINLDNSETADAINPMLYPDLMDDNGFVTSLFSIRVKSADGEIDTDYYTYLKSYQKKPWWSGIFKWIGDGIKSIFPGNKEAETGQNGDGFNPYWLSEADNGRAETVRGNIRFTMNEKNGVISVVTKAQDPLVAKTLADSVLVHLQEFIIAYRTNKARIDVEHYDKLAEEALAEYEEACKEYSRYSDANRNIVLTAANTQLGNLEKDMQLKYNSYTTLMAQLEMAKAKLQERTPAFTVIKGASVPVRPAGPKRMMFVFFMMVFAMLAVSVYILRKDLTKIISISGAQQQ